jgi:branched-subunit amino acid transport protein
MPDAVRRYLDALPIAVIAALAGAGIAMPDELATGGAEVGAAAVAVALAVWRRNLLLAVLGGVLTVALLRAVGL